jgi:signal transduction histidine kinase
VIERQVAHMSRLIDDLLDMARISSGKLLLRRERVTIAAVAAAALETSRPAIDAGGHRLVTRMSAADAVLEADPTRLAQVLTNLLNNAAKYTAPGGVIELHADQVGKGDRGVGRHGFRPRSRRAVRASRTGAGRAAPQGWVSGFRSCAGSWAHGGDQRGERR